MPFSPTLRDTFAVTCIFAASNALLILVASLHRRCNYRPETTRKLLHLGMGLVSLSYPFVFDSPLPVLVINGSFVVVLLVGRLHGPLGNRWHHLTSRIDRQTLGEFYFPMSITLLFLLTANDPLLFCIPVLILTISDAAAALIGCHYGLHPYRTAAGAKASKAPSSSSSAPSS